MKIIVLVAVICLSSLNAFALTPYLEVDINVLKVAPEEYSSKKIVFTSTYTRYSTTFLPYMEKSGIETGKYFWLDIGGFRLPVIAKKNDEMNSLVADLKRGKTVKVYGRVKKFKKDPQQTLHSVYYVRVDKIEPVDDVPVKPAVNSSVTRPPMQKRRAVKWRRNHLPAK